MERKWSFDCQQERWADIEIDPNDRHLVRLLPLSSCIGPLASERRCNHDEDCLKLNCGRATSRRDSALVVLAHAYLWAPLE